MFLCRYTFLPIVCHPKRRQKHSYKRIGSDFYFYIMYIHIKLDILVWKAPGFSWSGRENQHIETRIKWPTLCSHTCIYKWISLSENNCIFIQVSLTSVPEGSLENNLALLLILAWRQTSDRPLSETMMAKYFDIYSHNQELRLRPRQDGRHFPDDIFK